MLIEVEFHSTAHDTFIFLSKITGFLMNGSRTGSLKVDFLKWKLKQKGGGRTLASQINLHFVRE